MRTYNMMIWTFDKCRRSRLPATVTLDELVCNPTVHASATQYSYVRLLYRRIRLL